MDWELLIGNGLRLTLLFLLICFVAGFFLLGGYHTLSFQHLIENKTRIIDWSDAHQMLAAGIFGASYLLLGLFGLPGSTVLNITSGMLFGFWKGLLLVILWSTLASGIAFLFFRFLFRGFVEAALRRRFPILDDELAREGAYFVFAIRLFPIIPYSISNLVLAVSPVPFSTYVWVTMVAMLPRYLLYVYAGAHLGLVRSPDDLFSPSLIVALGLLAFLPWALKRLAPKVKNRLKKR